METNFLGQALIYLAAAVIGVPLLKRLGLSSVLGYIVAGAAIGPWGLGLAADVEGGPRFAEIGIVLLLFLIGLEVLPSRLWELRRSVFGLGAAQVAVTGSRARARAWALGVAPGAARRRSVRTGDVVDRDRRCRSWSRRSSCRRRRAARASRCCCSRTWR